MVTEALRALFACVREPAHHSALRCHSSVCFSSNQVGIFITKKREKSEGNQLDAPPPRISGFGVVANMATCNFIEISCNFLSLKITISLLEQPYPRLAAVCVSAVFFKYRNNKLQAEFNYNATAAAAASPPPRRGTAHHPRTAAAAP